MFFYWSLPVALPLILAAPVSVLLSRVKLGQGLRTRGWLLPAEELRVAFVMMASQGRALGVGVSRYPAIEVYVSQDDGETWAG